jgi:hypothetical protein
MNMATKPLKRLKSNGTRPSIQIRSEDAAEVKRASGPVLLKSGGRTTGVALNLKSYRHMVAEIERVGALVGIARGLRDIAEGRYMTLEEFRAHMERRFAISRPSRAKRGR